jgi:hypothetical protein
LESADVMAKTQKALLRECLNCKTISCKVRPCRDVAK